MSIRENNETEETTDFEELLQQYGQSGVDYALIDENLFTEDSTVDIRVVGNSIQENIEQLNTSEDGRDDSRNTHRTHIICEGCIFFSIDSKKIFYF